MATKYKRKLTDIISDTILSMDFTVTIYKVTPGVSKQILFVNDTYHAQAGFPITIGTTDYIIDSVDNDNSKIIVKGGTITATTFSIYNPYFFYGTPKETNVEITQETNEFNKTPMIWLLETFSETFHNDPEDSIERESTMRLFFLTQANFDNLTGTMKSNYVEPMLRLKDNFIKALEDNYTVFEKWNLDLPIVEHNKFGVYISNQGVNKNLFADNLTGCELNFTVEISKPQPTLKC